MKSSALVIGCGALGNEVLKNLVLMGVEHITIMDFDVVEEGNLSRSVLFSKNDVGERKVVAARRSLLRLNPGACVETIDGDVAYDLGLGTVMRADMIFGCVDSRWARYCIQRLCLQAGKTWVDGGILNLEGTVRTFRPGCTCYACCLGPEGLRDLRRRMPCSGVIRRQVEAGHAPTTPIIASIIGAVMVQEAMKEETDGRMFYYEGESMTVQTPLLEAWDEDCALHGEWQMDGQHTIAVTPEMTVAEAIAAAQGRTVVLRHPFVDCIIDRRTDERHSMMLPAHKVEGRILSDPTLAGRLFSDFYQHEWRELTADFPWQDLTLGQLGVPREEILEVNG